LREAVSFQEGARFVGEHLTAPHWRP